MKYGEVKKNTQKKFLKRKGEVKKVKITHFCLDFFFFMTCTMCTVLETGSSTLKKFLDSSNYFPKDEPQPGSKVQQ